MKDIYLQAMQEIEDTGKLSRSMRQSLQVPLNQAQKKQLALSCIENIVRNGQIHDIQNVRLKKF